MKNYEEPMNLTSMDPENAERSNLEEELVTFLHEVVVKDCERLNVRLLPKMSADILGTVTKGTRLPVYEETQEWCRVKSVYGDGFVMKKFTEVI